MKKLIFMWNILCSFKNPLAVIRFRLGNFVKGQKYLLKPKKGQPFYVSRSGDFWLIDRVVGGQEIRVLKDEKYPYGILEIDQVFLRQGSSDTFIYKEIFIDEVYKEYVNFLNPQSIVVDIGSHVGLFALYCSVYCQKVFSYEACKENYEFALRNAEANRGGDISFHHLAVWSRSDDWVFVPESSGINTSEVQLSFDKEIPGDSNKANAKTISIPDIFKKNGIDPCDLLKMDIEGAEYEALLNVSPEIMRRIKAICMEYHPDLSGQHMKNDLINFLAGHNFSVHVQEYNDKTGLIFARKKDE